MCCYRFEVEGAKEGVRRCTQVRKDLLPAALPFLSRSGFPLRTLGRSGAVLALCTLHGMGA